MLYQLGVLSIKVHPFNVSRVSSDAATDYVAKPVLGREPPMEYVGEGANTWRLTGDLFPRVIGGLNELQLLQAMRTSGRPQYLLRGDGTPLGWVVIEKVSTLAQYLGTDGVGQKITVDIEVRRAGRPSRLALFSIVQGLFS